MKFSANFVRISERERQRLVLLSQRSVLVSTVVEVNGREEWPRFIVVEDKFRLRSKGRHFGSTQGRSVSFRRGVVCFIFTYCTEGDLYLASSWAGFSGVKKSAAGDGRELATFLRLRLNHNRLLIIFCRRIYKLSVWLSIFPTKTGLMIHTRQANKLPTLDVLLLRAKRRWCANGGYRPWMTDPVRDPCQRARPLPQKWAAGPRG